MAKHGDDRVVFKQPAEFLSDLDAGVAAQIVTSSADLALIIEGGVIQDIAVSTADLVDEGYVNDWQGKPWIETVTPDSRQKIEELLAGHIPGKPRWRQVNHPSVSALDVPIRYTAVPIGQDNRVLAIGRDLRTVSKLQQRLVEAHQHLERDYARLREAEARYRLLFEAVSEPVIIVNARTLIIDEANAAAAELCGQPLEDLADSRLLDHLAPEFRREIEMVTAEAGARGSASSGLINLASGKTCTVMVSAFREDRASWLIVRMLEPRGDTGEATSQRKLFHTLEYLPDGLLVVDEDLRVLTVNAAFRDMVKLAGDTEAVGSRLGDFLGRSSTDLNVLMSALRNHGVVRNFATVLRDRFGAEEAVELSAVAAPGPQYGLAIRNVARRLQSGTKISEQLPKSVEQVTGLVGRVPLKEIVRESTELIEKLCLEAALELTDHNRASAAEMLGLSRQGLYSKLKRAGIDTRPDRDGRGGRSE